ncbi:hypothetical protein [Helicobacter sp. 23-1045]
MRELDYGEFDYDELESDFPPPPVYERCDFHKFPFSDFKKRELYQKMRKIKRIILAIFALRFCDSAPRFCEIALDSATFCALRRI